MPQTRSATRNLHPSTPEATREIPVKRKYEVAAPSPVAPKSKRSKRSHAELTDQSKIRVVSPPLEAHSDETIVNEVLSFSFEEAKAHLVRVDSRFAELFRRLKCKPFQHLDQVHPFRSLVQSILGQQISWLAARSIIHKFVRLYDATLPEKPVDFSHIKSPVSFFPTPQEVSRTDISVLRSAGLSMRKAEYVKDLAARFADGRLSTMKLLQADDEELTRMLTEVRGIGRWTVDMFAIFTLRRPNILPVGDMGVQRGMARWFGGASFQVRSDKAEDGGTAMDTLAGESRGHAENDSLNMGCVGASASNTARNGTSLPEGFVYTNCTMPRPARGLNSKTDAHDVLPTVVRRSPEATQNDLDNVSVPRDCITSESVSDLSPNLLITSPTSGSLPTHTLPQPFTPSISKVVDGVTGNGDYLSEDIVPSSKSLPHGLTPAIMKSRLDGKKIKGAFLTPQEMEALAAEWVPYRSLAVYYMWALVDRK
ncbi:hypothetical protein ID866_2000 [Astraeus odoratus]|nr:hypothetical protein ID866_2000 [Astraeus odoratus]